MEDIVIIGSGCAGLSAAIYAARAGLNPLVLEGGQPGGLITTTNEVENFPAFPEGVNGFDLAWKMREQALKFGARIEGAIVERAELLSSPKKLFCEGGNVIEAAKVVVATGSSPRMTGAKNESNLYGGGGVSTCATCDGAFYRNMPVAVVGGGDTACEEAIYLAGLAKQVYLVVRKPYLRASKIMQERVLSHPHIQVLFEHNAVGLYGENGVEGMHVVKRMGEPDEERYDVPVDGFFLAIGHKPNSDIFKPWVKTDETGYILTEAGTPRTGIPGVFAAGDVADPHYRQAITAAGSGCQAAIEAERYLSANGML